jgi:peptidoglycan hydrolase-like protein with peptidoglycan-binding domain
MTSSVIIRGVTAFAVVALCAACSSMNRQEKGTAIGATSGAVAGAAVGGPVGAAVGGAAGAVVGHEGTAPDRPGVTRSAPVSEVDATTRSAQEALNARGYNAGPADGRWGPATENAVLAFQKANGLSQTGRLDSATLAALGVPR